MIDRLTFASKECPEDTFECTSTNTCIKKIYLCDGMSDCLNSEDEKNCTTVNNFFWCDNREIISTKHVCNHIKDCSDESDELNCGIKFFV